MTKRQADKRKDYMRPVRTAERIHLRVLEACERGDKRRAEVLIRRARRVRDYQIAVWGH